MDRQTRWEMVKVVQEHYKDIYTFAEDVLVNVLGFEVPTRIQQDILSFVSGRKVDPTTKEVFYDKDLFSALEAQRGEAKTTLTAIYALFSLIHNPKSRILIVSAGREMSNTIAILIYSILFNMDVLEIFRPDRAAGQRSSATNFDVHWHLREPDKSPSVTCLSITSNIQGYRADLLIADDVESSKNANTDVQREKVLLSVREFSSICSAGQILFLGTPQTENSIYNTLPAKGCTLRIYPGRYPTPEQLAFYGDHLAPIIKEDLERNPLLGTGGGLDKTQGQPTDPFMFDDEALCTKELNQGAAHFQLQFMLNTALMDANRCPLKLEDIMFLSIPKQSRDESTVFSGYVYGRLGTNTLEIPRYSSVAGKTAYRPVECISNPLMKYSGTIMYVDPSGGGANGDEFAYAITSYCNSYVYVLDCGGFPGGYQENNLEALADLAKAYDVDTILIESNFGNGIFRQVLTPIVHKKHPCTIEDIRVHTQKEKRIIDSLEPVMSTHRLIVNDRLLEKDPQSTHCYPLEKRKFYELFYQMVNVSYESGCLKHDDRLDALAGAVQYWTDIMCVDEEIARKQYKKDQWVSFIKDPLKKGRVTNSLYKNKSYTLGGID